MKGWQAIARQRVVFQGVTYTMEHAWDYSDGEREPPHVRGRRLLGVVRDDGFRTCVWADAVQPEEMLA